MNKSQLLLLQDFQRDKKDIRLQLFCNSLNPSFKINKNSRQQIDLLISDLEADSSNKQRLKNLESFITGLTSSQKKVKEIKTSNKLSALTDGPKDKSMIELRELQSKFMQIREEYRRNPVPFLKEKMEELQLKVYIIEEAKGFYKKDPLAQEKTEIILIKNILGDWNIPGTMAYIMINGGLAQFTFPSFWHPDYLLEILSKNSGKKCRNYIVSSNIGAANYKGPKKGTVWTLTDKLGGAAPPPDPKDQTDYVSMR